MYGISNLNKLIYSLEFEKRALKEWKKLGHPIKGQLKKKLAERLENPHVPSARLSGRGKKTNTCSLCMSTLESLPYMGNSYG